MAVLLVVASIASTTATDVLAQSVPPISTAQASDQRAFNIPPQPLGTALGMFGQQSGRQITVDGALVRGISTPGVQGMMTTDQALSRLLEGTGLLYRFTSATTVTVERPGGASGAMQLDPVQVQGNPVPPQAEIGNLPPPYAGGEVARGSRVGILGNRDYMDTPFSTTSYTEKYLVDQQARSIVEAIQGDPTIRPLYGSSPAADDRMFIRGFAVSSSDWSFGGVQGIAPVFGTQMAGIERLEVFRGPGTFLNGASPTGAIGGTLNLVPKRAADTPLTEVSAFYITSAQFGGSLDFGRRFGPDNSVGIRANAIYTGGGTSVAHQSNENLNLVLGFDFRGPDTRLDGDIGYQRRNLTGASFGALIVAGVPIPPPPNGAINLNQAWETFDTESVYGALRFEHDFTRNLTAFFRIGANRSNQDMVANYPFILNYAGDANASDAFRQKVYTETLSGEAGLRAHLSTGPLRHELGLGASYMKIDTGAFLAPLVSSFNTNIYAPSFAPAPSLFGSDGSPTKTSETVFTSLGIVDSIFAANDRVQVFGGARLQRLQTSNYNAMGVPTQGNDQSVVSPSVGFVVKPWEFLSFYGNFIQALQQGPTAGLGLTNAGETFPPFVAKQFELGLKLDLGNFGATLAAYQITRQLSYVDPATNALTVNGQQQNKGLEFTVFGEPIVGLKPLGGFTLLDPIQQNTAGGLNDGKQAPGIPNFMANLGIDWDTPLLKGGGVMARVVYTSQAFRDAANTQSFPAWTRFDAGLRYVFERPGDNKPIAVRANVTNLFGMNYWVGPGAFMSSAPPQTFFLSLTTAF